MPSKSNEYSYESGRIASATVEASSAAVLAADPDRRYARLCNTGNTDCFLAIGTDAVAGQGVFLKAGGGFFEIWSCNLTHAAVSAITASGETTLSIQEGL